LGGQRDETSVSDGTGAHADAEELEPGTTVGSYRVQSLIASGGGGMVYRAEHTLIGRSAAVKVLRRHISTSGEAVGRFVREARVVNLIRHPNIVDIEEFGQLSDGRRYLVMELLEGPDLSEQLRSRGRLPVAEVHEILLPLCAALEAAHAAGVVHRDVKASNVSFARVNGTRVLKLLDFGIAKLLRPDAEAALLSTLGTRLGTPCAMAPEQIRGERVDHRVDIYALGVLVYQLLTGRYPFVADSLPELDRLHLEGAPARPSSLAPLPGSLDAVVLRCMEKDAGRRFDSVAAFLRAFADAVSAQATSDNVAQRTLGAPVIYVEACAENPAEEDDHLFEDICTVTELAEQSLLAAGFELPLCTKSSLLGFLAGRPAPAGERAPNAYAQAVAEDLARRLTERPGAHPGLWVNVTLHAHRATPGEALSIGAWAPKERVTGVHLSAEAQLALRQEREKQPEPSPV
jgi:serine/threonine protein kinase